MVKKPVLSKAEKEEFKKMLPIDKSKIVRLAPLSKAIKKFKK